MDVWRAIGGKFTDGTGAIDLMQMFGLLAIIISRGRELQTGFQDVVVFSSRAVFYKASLKEFS